MRTAVIAIFADRHDRCIKSPICDMPDNHRHSPSVPVPVIFYANRCKSPINQDRLFLILLFKMVDRSNKMEPGNKLEVPHCRDQRKKSPGVSTGISGENRLLFSLAIKFAAIGKQNCLVYHRLKKNPSRLINKQSQLF